MKKHWLMFLAFGVILALAVIGIVYGVTTHEEPGFTHAENQWGVVPVSVSCAGYAPADEGACAATAEAVSRLNHRLGFEMLAPTEGEGQIHVVMRAPVEVHSDGPCGQPGECFELTGTGATYEGCEVRTMNASGPDDLELLVVYHGLGHCLGLAHDDYAQSIMRPVQRATPDRTIPPWISDWDRDLLRAKYAP